MRRAARKDTNQSEIVDALRERGFLVAFTHRLGDGMPDILCAAPRADTGRWELLWVEIKSLGGILTKDERTFHYEWRDAPVIVAYSHHDILKWFGWRDAAIGGTGVHSSERRRQR